MADVMKRDGIPAFLAGVAGQERCFRAGDILDAPGLNLLVSGQVGLWRDGVRCACILAGDSFGEASLFSSPAPYQALAEQDGEMVHYPARHVLLHLRVHGDLGLAFAAFVTQKLDDLRQQAAILRLKGAEERILTYLHGLGAKNSPVTIPGTLQTLALRLGLTHEALYRALRRLQENGQIIRPGQRSFQFPPAPITNGEPAGLAAD